MDASTIILYVSRAAALLIAIPFHESAHALTAEMLGDKTGRNSGRISMNPARHFDLFGFLCLMFTGVGWAKPTPVNPSNFKNEKAGMALTALAGPVSNVVLSFLACVLLRVASMTWLLYSGSMESWLYYL
ncbi:MAG: site-2 protease family protein, partial [Oscillospiraceae bacterium]